jgi:hypothetical protein
MSQLYEVYTLRAEKAEFVGGERNNKFGVRWGCG